MKRFIYLLLICSFLNCTKKEMRDKLDANRKNNQEITWVGSYDGVVPCSDCEEIKASLKINSDSTYSISLIYVGRENNPVKLIGPVHWDSKDSVITLLEFEDQDFGGRLSFDENKIIILDKKQVLDNEENEFNFILNKQ